MVFLVYFRATNSSRGSPRGRERISQKRSTPRSKEVSPIPGLLCWIQKNLATVQTLSIVIFGSTQRRRASNRIQGKGRGGVCVATMTPSLGQRFEEARDIAVLVHAQPYLHSRVFVPGKHRKAWQNKTHPWRIKRYVLVCGVHKLIPVARTKVCGVFARGKMLRCEEGL